MKLIAKINEAVLFTTAVDEVDWRDFLRDFRKFCLHDPENKASKTNTHEANTEKKEKLGEYCRGSSSSYLNKSCCV